MTSPVYYYVHSTYGRCFHNPIRIHPATFKSEKAFADRQDETVANRKGILLTDTGVAPIGKALEAKL